jgi:hypothetical protein
MIQDAGMQLFLEPLPVLERQQVAERLKSIANYLGSLPHPPFRTIASEASRITRA